MPQKPLINYFVFCFFRHPIVIQCKPSAKAFLRDFLKTFLTSVHSQLSVCCLTFTTLLKSKISLNFHFRLLFILSHQEHNIFESWYSVHIFCRLTYCFWIETFSRSCFMQSLVSKNKVIEFCNFLFSCVLFFHLHDC